MVNKSKLKMALLAEKPVDFKKEHQKKMARKARKEKVVKAGNGGEEWEDVDGEEEDDEDDEDDEEEGEGEEVDGEDEEEKATKIDFAGIDDSDSGSSSGVEDNNGEDFSDDDEDIPMSDLEDLPDEEKEDIIPHQRLTINNTAALTTSLKRIALPLSTLAFSEHQSLTTVEPVAIADVSDDLSRELAFYAQCLDAVKIARQKLKDEGAPFSRPKDYFAEMVKADEHMAKIKAKLIDAAASKKAASEARKQRDLKKFGKQVQVAKIQEREKEKRTTLDKIKTLKRKRQGADNETTNEADMFDVALDDEAGDKSNRRDSRGKSGDNKRAKKDAKYGHGGKKRHGKSGDAMSSGDLSGFSAKAMKARDGGRTPGAKKQRPGKGRRASGRK